MKRSTAFPAVPVRVTFPTGVVPCPSCGLHYHVTGQRIWAARCALLVQAKELGL